MKVKYDILYKLKPKVKGVEINYPVLNNEVELNNIEGTIVGFKCPEYVKDINVTEYHLHFISKDKHSGGHVLDLEIENGNVEVDYINQFSVFLPESKSFYDASLKHHEARELHRVEGH